MFGVRQVNLTRDCTEDFRLAKKFALVATSLLHMVCVCVCGVRVWVCVRMCAFGLPYVNLAWGQC